MEHAISFLASSNGLMTAIQSVYTHLCSHCSAIGPMRSNLAAMSTILSLRLQNEDASPAYDALLRFLWRSIQR
jgi:hypothetical protein